MKVSARILSAVLALVLLPGLGRPASAQSTIGNADVQRLQDSIYAISRDVSQAKTRDAGMGARLETELDDARDETIYLRVKIRKNEPISQGEYTDLRDRIESIRTRAQGTAAPAPAPAPAPAMAPAPAPAPAPAARPAAPVAAAPTSTATSASTPGDDIPVGTEFDVRLQKSLSSATALVEDRFEATTAVDLSKGDKVIVPAGSVVRGVVSSVNKAGRVDRKGSMTLAFDQVTLNGRAYPIRATVTDTIASEGVSGEKAKIGTGAGVGAIIGGLLGGFKGALAGLVIGGGGTIAATDGKDVELAAGSTLRVRLDTPLTLK